MRALSDVMRVVERSSSRECTLLVLSSVRLHFPRLYIERIRLGVPQGCDDNTVQAAEAEMAPIADDIVADMDLGDEE